MRKFSQNLNGKFLFVFLWKNKTWAKTYDVAIWDTYFSSLAIDILLQNSEEGIFGIILDGQYV